jgi:arylsulfatase A
MNWKLHIARHNTGAYVPSPAVGRHSYLLPRPELYNLANDPDESYDVAPENSQVVEQIRSTIAKMLHNFPEEVQKAWAEQDSRKANPATPTGAYPQPVRQ